MSNKVLVTGSSVRAEILQPLREQGWTVENPTQLLGETELQEALKDVDAYLLGGDEVATRAALSSAAKLRVIAFLGMGYEKYLDTAAARELGIIVTNTPGTLSEALAELTIAHLLNCVRKVHYYASLYEREGPGREEKQRNLAALHHGVVGLGETGTRVAGILRNGFGARVSYFSRTRKPAVEAELGISYLELDDLAAAVDSLIVLTLVNDETEGLIGTRQLTGCRPGLFLVDTAGPSVVDPHALNAALDSGQVAYAAFDNFYPAGDPVIAALKSKAPKRLTITGHIGSLTQDARDAMGALAVKEIISMLNTGTPLHRVV
jgi:lactate dehydrogenase-like 2-hydroxyacid dehydrogenase